jgi:hypothetical protein
MYNRLPENEPCGSKHVQDIEKIKISLTNMHFIGLYYTVILQHTLQRILKKLMTGYADKC